MPTKFVEIDPSVGELVKACDGYCPCAITREPDTKCPCKDFRERLRTGLYAIAEDI